MVARGTARNFDGACRVRKDGGTEETKRRFADVLTTSSEPCKHMSESESSIALTVHTLYRIARISRIKIRIIMASALDGNL